MQLNSVTTAVRKERPQLKLAQPKPKPKPKTSEQKDSNFRPLVPNQRCGLYNMLRSTHSLTERHCFFGARTWDQHPLSANATNGLAQSKPNEQSSSLASLLGNKLMQHNLNESLCSKRPLQNPKQTRRLLQESAADRYKPTPQRERCGRSSLLKQSLQQRMHNILCQRF